MTTRGVARTLMFLELLLAAVTPASALVVPTSRHGLTTIAGSAQPALTPSLSWRAPQATPRRASGVYCVDDKKPPAVSKQALVDAIALKAGVSKKTASLVLSATLDVIVDSVSKGHKVSLIGFGTFSAKERPEREGRNPKTGEKMLVKAATVPSFSFGKGFKDAVKASGSDSGSQ